MENEKDKTKVEKLEIVPKEEAKITRTRRGKWKDLGEQILKQLNEAGNDSAVKITFTSQAALEQSRQGLYTICKQNNLGRSYILDKLVMFVYKKEPKGDKDGLQ